MRLFGSKPALPADRRGEARRTVNARGVVSAAGLAFIACGLLLVGHPAIRAFLDGRWAARGRA